MTGRPRGNADLRLSFCLITFDCHGHDFLFHGPIISTADKRLDRGEQPSARPKWASANFSVRAFPLPHQHHREHNRHQQYESASKRRCSHLKPCHGLLRQK
jgi:hypothetical protein